MAVGSSWTHSPMIVNGDYDNDDDDGDDDDDDDDDSAFLLAAEALDDEFAVENDGGAPAESSIPRPQIPRSPAPHIDPHAWTSPGIPIDPRQDHNAFISPVKHTGLALTRGGKDDQRDPRFPQFDMDKGKTYVVQHELSERDVDTHAFLFLPSSHHFPLLLQAQHCSGLFTSH